MPVSQENLTLARHGFEAFNRRDVDELVELSHPDCEWLPFRAQLEGYSYRGHEGVRRFIVDMAEDWSRFEIELEELTDVDGRVLLIGRVHALARGSGVAVENRSGFVLEFSEGLICRLVSYSDPDDARRAASASA